MRVVGEMWRCFLVLVCGREMLLLGIVPRAEQTLERVAVSFDTRDGAQMCLVMPIARCVVSHRVVACSLARRGDARARNRSIYETSRSLGRLTVAHVLAARM